MAWNIPYLPGWIIPSIPICWNYFEHGGWWHLYLQFWSTRIWWNKTKILKRSFGAQLMLKNTFTGANWLNFKTNPRCNITCLGGGRNISSWRQVAPKYNYRKTAVYVSVSASYNFLLVVLETTVIPITYIAYNTSVILADDETPSNW